MPTLPRPQAASLVYHDVTDDPTRSGFQRVAAASYKHSRDAFERHLNQIAKGKVSPSLLPDVDLNGVARYLLLTFDDGGKSAVHIGDELCKRGWKGHFFITTGVIGTRTFLNADEIRYLRSCGHFVGSHSHEHPNIFTELTADRMLAEWRTSCGIISEILGEPCVAASVPGGDTSIQVVQSAEAAGIKFLFTSEPELTPWRTGNIWVFGRASIKAGTSLRKVHRLATFTGWTRELAIRRMKVAARTILAPAYRAYVLQTTKLWGLTI